MDLTKEVRPEEMQTYSISHLTQEREALSREVDDLRVDLTRIRREINSNVAETHKSKDELEAEIRILTASFKAKEAESTLKRAQIEVQTEEAIAQKYIVDRELAKIRRTIASSESLIQSFEQKKVESESLAERARLEKKEAEDLAVTLREERVNLNAAVASSQEEMNQILKEINEKAALLEQGEKNKDRIAKEIELLIRNRTQLTSEVENIKLEQASAIRASTTANLDISELKSRKEKLERQNILLDENRANSKSEYQLEVKRAEKLVADLKAEAEQKSLKLVETAQKDADILKERILQEVREFKQKAERDAHENMDSITKRAQELKSSSERYSKETREQCETAARELREMTERETTRIRESTDKEISEKRARLSRDLQEERRQAEKELSDQLSKNEAETLERLRLIEAELEQRNADKMLQADNALKDAQANAQAKKEAIDIEVEDIRLETKKNVEETIRKSTESANSTLSEANTEAERIRNSVAEVKRELEEKAKKDAEEFIAEAKQDIEQKRTDVDRYAEETKQKADKEYTDRKSKMDNDLAASKVRETEELRIWRSDQESEHEEIRKHETNEVIRNLEVVLNQKLQELGGSTANPEAVAAIGPEVLNVVRQVLNKEDAAPNMSQIQELLPFNSKRAKKNAQEFWIKYVGGSVTVLTLIIVLFIYPGYWTDISNSFSDYLDNKSSASDDYVDKFKADRKKKMAYNPIQTKAYKSSYSDNVLFTTNFVSTVMSDKKFQKKWTRDLNKFFKDTLDMDDRIIVKFIVLEDGLVKKLAQMRRKINPGTKAGAISRMKKYEQTVLRKVKKLMGGIKNYNKFRLFRKKFYNDYRNKK